MALIAFNWKPTLTQLRWFGCLWLPLFLIAISTVVMLKAAFTGLVFVLAPVALVSMLLGVVAPRLLKPIFVGLLLVTFPIGFVISHVVLAVLFFLLLTPVAVLMRFCGRDALRLRFERDARSYWIPRHGRASMWRYFRQF